MIKYLKLAFICLVMVSCNSTDKKNKSQTTKSNKTAKVTSTSNSSEIKPDKTKKEEEEEEEEPKQKYQETLLAESIERGKTVYTDMCITCHLPNGKGVPKAFPPVADSDFLREKQKESIIGIKKGMSGKIVVNGITYNSVMSPLGLSSKEVADVMNYINNAWGNDIDNFVTPEEVSKL